MSSLQIYNVPNGENVLFLSTGVSLTVTPGFYIPAEFVALLQTICPVTYNAGKLNWTLGAGVSITTQSTKMREILGLTLKFYVYRHVQHTALSCQSYEHRL